MTLACVQATGAQAAPATIATYGEGAGKVNNPSGTAVDPNPASPDYRHLYVADGNNFRISKFGPEGDFLLAWGFGVADGKSNEPQVCGPAAEPPTKRCFAGSNTTARASGAIAPKSLAVDPATGDVFASDSGNKRVSKYAPDGEFLLAFGGGVASGGAEGTGDLVAGSKVIKGLTLSEKRFLQGQVLTAAGGAVPPGSEVTSVGAGQLELELSKPATETATGVAISAAEDPGNVSTDEQQLIALDPAAASGNFKLRFTPPLGATQSTANIPFNASPGEVQAALAALAAIGPGNVLVGAPNPGGGSEAGGPYEVEFTGLRYADTDVAQLQLTAGEPNLNEAKASTVQTTRQGALTAEACTTDCLEGRLAELPGVFAESNFAAQGPSPNALAFDPADDLWVLSGGRLQRFDPADGAFLSEVAIPAGSQVRGLAIDPVSDDFYVLGPHGANEVQNVVTDRSSGAFNLGFEGQSTGPLPAGFPTDAGAEAIQAALEGLSTVGEGNVGVEAPTGGGYVVVAFIADLGGRDLPPMSASGGSPPVTLTQGAQGTPGSVLRLDTSGALVETLADAPGHIPKALLTDSAGNLYVGDAAFPYRFRRYDSDGQLSSVFGAGQVIGGGIFGSGPGAGGNALALDEASGRLYSASSSPSEAESVVQRFGLPAPGPLFEDLGAKDVLPTSATLAASLNPEGKETHYRFQYLTKADYEAQGSSFEGPATEETPEETLASSGYEPEAASAVIDTLIPATEYRFRLLAENEDGEVAPEATFATRPAIAIEAQWATDVAARTAALRAELDPLGPEADWWIEYGTTSAYGNRTPAATLPAGFGAREVGSTLSGLSPATTYHYRFAASDQRGPEGEEVEYTVHGPGQSFLTQIADLGFELPDRRVWEMVSPPDKHGGRIVFPEGRQGGPFRAAAGGESLAYLSIGSLVADPEGNRALEASSVLARRGAGGSWSSEDLTPPHENITPPAIGTGLEYRLFSSDLRSALLEPRDDTPLSPHASERTAYLRQNLPSPDYTPLVVGCPAPPTPCPAQVAERANVPAGTVFGNEEASNTRSRVAVWGATADLSQVVLGPRGIAGQTPVRFFPGDGDLSLYEWSAGGLAPVSVPPGEERAVNAELGSGQRSASGAISEDGSRVFWSSLPGSSLTGLYVRDLARGETARLDEVQEGGFGTGAVKPLFQGANAAGSVAFFTDTHNLTADANEEGADLYRCELVVEEDELLCDLTDLTAETAEFGEAADVLGLLPGASEDGTQAYLVARGVLDGAPSSNGELAVQGEPNLYLWRQSGGIRFVATLSEQDAPAWGGQPGGSEFLDVQKSAAASPSGRYLAFMSRRPLSGYDNRDASTGKADQEVFLYDADADELTCASCSPAGGRPVGAVGGEAGLPEGIDSQETWNGTPLAATLPGPTKIELGGISLYRPRFIHDNGRLHFNSLDALVPADSNGNADVYQYEPHGTGTCTASAIDAGTAALPDGCLSLISSGTSASGAAFLDASQGGSDVFFTTEARLSVKDEDGVTDIYDARVDGEPAVLSPLAECQGEACQPPPAVPAPPTPASAAFRGPGNLREAPASRCAANARRAARLYRRARRLRRASGRVRRGGAPRRNARQANRKARRIARRARRASARAKRCRRQSLRAER